MFGKKVFSIFAVLAIFTFGVFAYDGTVFSCEILEAYSSTRFDEIIGSDAFEQALYEEVAADADGTVDKFFAITQDSIDDEDMDVIEGVEDYIDRQEKFFAAEKRLGNFEEIAFIPKILSRLFPDL